MSVTHFQTSLAWWVFPLSQLLHRLGFSRTQSARIIAHGIRVKIARPTQLPHNPMKYEGRDLTPEQRQAVVQSDSRWTENEWQENARRAESLGFRDEDDAA